MTYNLNEIKRKSCINDMNRYKLKFEEGMHLVKTVE